MVVPEENLPEVAAAVNAVIAEAEATGVWVFGAGLEHQVPSVVGIDGSVTDGPFPESKEHLGGFSVVDVATRAEAIECAKKLAVACRRPQEVFEVLPDPTARPPLATAGGREDHPSMSAAFVVPPGAGRRLDLGTFEANVLADAGQTGEAFTILQTQNEPSGFGPPLHIHRDAAEAFYVLEGEYLMFMDDREELCPAGSFVYVPQGTPHTFQVVSATPGKKLNLFAPAAMVGFFEELATAEAEGRATPELVDVIAERHDMEVVGPVPETYLRGG